MSVTETPTTGIPSTLMAELRAAAELAAHGPRDPPEMRRARERMDRTRERIRQRIGTIDFGVPTIRALRDGDDA